MKKNVPIIVQNINSNFFFEKSIIDGLKKCAEKSGLVLEFFDNADDVLMSEYVIESKIIVVGYVEEWVSHTIEILIKKDFEPLVVNAWTSSSIRKFCSCVCFQLNDAVEQAMRYLTLSGRKKIALFGTDENSMADLIKEETYKQVISNKDSQTSHFIFRAGSPIYESIDIFIDNFIKNEIDAVICANDIIAICLISRLIENGFNIPDDIYVIGMGNSCLSHKFSIPISTIDLDYEELGYKALELWKFFKRNKNKIHVELTVPCTFITRASTDYYICGRFEIADSQADGVYIENNIGKYYVDETIKRLIKFEEFLRSCDDADYQVIKEILKGKSDIKIAELINMSDRAIRYRINKMAKRLGVKTREEIINKMCDFNII